MSLSTALVTNKPADKAGSSTQGRYEFQTHWGPAHLLDLHSKGEEYAVAFEFHDDIVVVDSATNPDRIRFFQVKTKDHGSWSVQSLTAKSSGKTGKKASIIGKLFANHTKFKAQSDHLGFVSNQPSSFLDQAKGLSCFAEMERGDFDTFLKKLQKEFPAATASDVSLFHYHTTDFKLNGYVTYLKGKIVEFVSKHCGPSDSDCEAFYRAIIDQCRKVSKNLDDVTSLADLLNAKFITRAQVDGWLADLKEKVATKPEWSSIQPHLASLPPMTVRKIHAKWIAYSLDRLQLSHAGQRQLRDDIRHTLQGLGGSTMSLLEILDACLPSIKPRAAVLIGHSEEDYLRAAILYEYCIP